MDVRIVEVSRDGLHNESVVLGSEAKVELITRLAKAGARRIEAVLIPPGSRRWPTPRRGRR